MWHSAFGAENPNFEVFAAKRNRFTPNKNPAKGTKTWCEVLFMSFAPENQVLWSDASLGEDPDKLSVYAAEAQLRTVDGVRDKYGNSRPNGSR